MTTLRTPRTGSLAACLLVAALLGGCGGGGGDQDAQPSTETSTFVEGRFDELPRMPGSEPLGAVSVTDDVVARSYRVTDVTAPGVVEWYAAEMAALGWQRTEPVNRDPSPSRGDWVDDELRLEVSAQEVDPGVQYSLVLRPR